MKRSQPPPVDTLENVRGNSRTSREFDEAQRELQMVLQGAPQNLAAIRGLAGIRADELRGHDRDRYAEQDDAGHGD